MRKQLLFTLGLIFVVAMGFSQGRLYKGGYGYVGIGVAGYHPKDFDDYLSTVGVMGPSFKWRCPGLTGGGEGYAEIRGWLIGGGAYGTIMPSMRSDAGSVLIGTGTAFVKTGYAVVQNGKQFLAVMAGFGAGGVGIDIKNNNALFGIAFDPQRPVPLGDERFYFLGHGIFDLGLSYKIVASNPAREAEGRFGGFIFGLDAGTWLGFRLDEWRYDGETTGNIDAPSNFVSPYLRLTIGGGGFRRPAEVR